MAARELAAPAADIRSGIVAPPTASLMRSTHALLQLTPGVATSFAVAVPNRFALAFVTPPGESALWRFRVDSADGRESVGDVAAHASAMRVTPTVGDVGELFGVSEWSARRWDVDGGAVGAWSMRCDSDDRRARGPCVAIIDDPNGPALLASWNSLRFVAGSPARLSLRWEGLEARGSTAIDATVSSSTGDAPEVRLDGDPSSMRCEFVPPTPGRYVVALSARIGVGDAEFVRTIETVIDVAPAGTRLTGGLERRDVDSLHDAIDLDVESDATGAFVAAEVWAREGDDVRPVCWIASVSPIATGERGKRIGLVLDRRWLLAERVSPAATLELRNVRLHDRDSWGLLDVIDAIPIGPAAVASVEAPFDLRELERGRGGGHRVAMTLAQEPVADDAAPGNHSLLIVHGYCSSGVTFPPAQFTGPVGVFFDPNQAISNDAFAQTLAAYGSQYKSYGVVAHSQGGLASLHLFTFYWSGLDWARPNATGGDRLIQSVGSPYQGTPLAGNLAVLGQIFGAGCGSVTDMTPDGATAWLSTIPTWARQEVWYWTTSFPSGAFNYCNFLSGLFLTDPEDGVVEKTRGQLPGANNMGHVTGWCHTTGMSYPAQYNDASRNAQMNAEAAR